MLFFRNTSSFSNSVHYFVALEYFTVLAAKTIFLALLYSNNSDSIYLFFILWLPPYIQIVVIYPRTDYFTEFVKRKTYMKMRNDVC